MGEAKNSDTVRMADDRTPHPAGVLWAPQAWVENRWQEDVLLQVGEDGTWAAVQIGVRAPAGAAILDGPALPGLVNAHSHSFQRAFAGLAERRSVDQDDFWEWRDRMYRVALRIDPEQQQAVAAQLFLELVRGGYTHVCEFHYLHNDRDGSVYTEDRVRMARALIAAAREVGIGLTLLPAVYERAGFSQATLREDQRRFRADADAVLAMREALRGASSEAASTMGGSLLRVGLALHSLRAVTPMAIERLLAERDDAPIHIHVAEQLREVDDCLAATGLRPIEWLCRNARPDQHWQLVHATQSTPGEIEAIARCGAGVVLCPSTESNLGDGVPDVPGLLRHRIPLSVGSDSQVTRSALEELRVLEYSQRLTKRVRCVAAAPHEQQPSTADRLWSRVLEGGGRAAGYASWGLQVGARADLLVVDGASPALLGVPASHTLDALVFSSPTRPFRDTMIAGRWITRNHHAASAAAMAQRFAHAMREIWQQAAGA